ncbi:ABC transporter permease [Actinopolymorpha alba]|uniref:ABC transporter permease n=1 Tax=Actinopolymorpha alba TaxID=533267 RepID=UPI000382CF88|nr:ABC transporter permease [Actinopolymorpha alba]
MTALPAIATAPRRMNPLRALRHGLTLTWRSLLKIRRNPEALIDVTLQPIIFVVLFVFIFGGAISGDWRSYLQFVLPGLMVQTIVFSTMGTGIALNTDIDKGVFDRFRSLPIARSGPLVGAVLGDLVRYALSLAVLLGFGAVLGFDFTGGFLGALAGCALVMGFALALCWAWVWLGVTMKKPQGVQGVGILLMFPLTFGSNVFVQAGTLPGWLQAFVSVNPVTYLVDATRGLILGGPVAQPVLSSLAWMAGLLVAFVPLALRAYRRRT